MLPNIYTDAKSFCADVMDFAVYKHAEGLLFGTIEERIKKAASFFGITLGNLSDAKSNGHRMLKQHTEPPFSSIEKDIIFDYYKNDKSLDDILSLSAYLALRSIIGYNAETSKQKSFAKTNNSHLLARMAGCNVFSNEMALPEVLKKICTRHHLSKLKNDLQTRWKVKIYARGVRGFYFSFTIKLDELVFQAERRKLINKERKRKNEMDQAVIKAKARLQNEFLNQKV